ncbi:MAG: 6-bladed beta-propeller [Phycisphaerales bacterium]|nr:6-bladed beta-propeller [Phycisphaerales bacterium]
MHHHISAVCLLSGLLPFLVGFHPAHELPAGQGEDPSHRPSVAAMEPRVEPVMTGPDVWTVVPDWGQSPELTIGNTHGGVLIDHDGRVLYNTDTERSILIHDADGAFVESVAGRFSGIHGMQLRIEEEIPYLYAAHLPGKQIVKLRMDGTHVWTIGVPMESGKYADDPNAYNPTAVAVAPDGRIFVADGYGRNWIHVFGPDLRYMKSFGGRGNGDGQFVTCHGMIIDTSSPTPMLIVCDRENRRLQRFTLEGEYVDTPVAGLRRPCSIAVWEGPDNHRLYAIAELEGRVTLLDGDMKVLGHLGDNPDRSHWANNGVGPDAWTPGITTAPHGVGFDADGNLYVQDWNANGRVHKFVRTRSES